MTNRKPPQYTNWDYPKDREYPNTLFGFHVNKILRWMGSDVWTFDEARLSMVHYGIDISYTDIEGQLDKGRKGIKVNVNLLDDEEMEEIYSSKKVEI